MLMDFEYMFSGLSAFEVECKLRQIIENALHQKYGDKPDELIKKRIIAGGFCAWRDSMIKNTTIRQERKKITFPVRRSLLI